MTGRRVFPSPDTKPALGIFVKSPDVDLARAAGSAGLDFAIVDLEHSLLGVREAGELVAVLDEVGVTPLVRLGRNDAVLTAKLLEAGAAGVQLANAEQAEDVHALRSASAFPPRGRRGVSFAHRAADWGLMSADDYVTGDREGAVVVQVESANLIGGIGELLDAGPNAVFIGLEDLRVSCRAAGVDFDGCVARFVDELQAAGVPWGCPSSPERVSEWVARGASFVTIGADRAVYAQALVQRRRTALGGSTLP